MFNPNALKLFNNSNYLNEILFICKVFMLQTMLISMFFSSKVHLLYTKVFVYKYIKICVQFSLVAQSCPTLCDPMNRSMPGLPVPHQLPEFTQTHVHRVSDAIQPSHPLSSPSPPAPIPPNIRVFSNESTLRMRWPKYWSLSFSISPSSEHPGLVSFRMDWLNLLAVQAPQFKTSIIRHSAFLIVQLSHPYMTTGKTTALTRRIFVGKVISPLFNMLSRLAPHSSTLAWKMPWMEEPGRLQSMGSLRVGHD